MLLVALLATVALVSMQYGFVSGAQIQTNKGNIDNNLLSNVIPTSHRRRQFVRIAQPPPDTARHVPGVDLELKCGVMGSPIPQIQWLRNGELVDDVVQETEESNELITVSPLSIATVVSTIIIRTPSPNAKDVYTCVGTAGVKKIKASTTVFTDNGNSGEFLQQLLALPSKPRITYYYQAILVQDFGSDLVLPCRVSSDLDVQLYWTDNAGEDVLGAKKYKVLPTGDLLIPNIQWAEMGDWTCVVKNYLGEDSQTTFFYPAPLA